MKTNKEYPATHSMDTAWFAVDLDGNVAIFQFEEDGPGPVPFTDLHTDDLIYFLSYPTDSINQIDFSDEQIDVLLSELKDPIAEQIKYGGNILVDPSQFNIVIGLGAMFDLCYSKEKGFYHLRHWSANIQKLQELIDNGTILKFCECNIEIYFEDGRQDQSEHRLAHFPFYVYEQGWGVIKIPERKVVPRCPFKENQLNEKAKEYTLRLPVHFATDRFVEPAEFIDSQYWSPDGKLKKVDGIEYMKVKLTNGGYGYVKVIPYTYPPKYPKGWEDAPRVINQSENHRNNDNK